MNTEFRILERVGTENTEIAVCDGSALVEYLLFPNEESDRIGAVYSGRVERVLPRVKAAFVELGFSKNGFLPIRESDGFHAFNGEAPLITGNDVLVQIQKEEKGDKGVFLTRDIRLPGQYVVLMPMNRVIGVSKRVADQTEKKKLYTMGTNIACGRFGLIMREASLTARESDVREEAEELFSSWQEAAKGWESRKSPALILQAPTQSKKIVSDYSGRHQVCFLSNSPEGICPEFDILWKNLRVDGQKQAALQRKVCVSGGATLVIDEREALQTIDVNSGSETMTAPGDSLAYTVNSAAIPEIARQIRLRNLTGIIIIDFIDMQTEIEREKILHGMEEALEDDRIKHVIHGFTRLGLLEMTRRRTGESLKEMCQ